jgi:hypothetical protein
MGNRLTDEQYEEAVNRNPKFRNCKGCLELVFRQGWVQCAIYGDPISQIISGVRFPCRYKNTEEVEGGIPV